MTDKIARKTLPCLPLLFFLFWLAGCPAADQESSLNAILIDMNETVIPVGLSTRITATARYDNGTVSDVSSAVIWSTSDARTAAFAAGSAVKGTVTAFRHGDVTITATLPEAGVSGSMVLTVIPPILTGLDIQPAFARIQMGQLCQYKAVGFFSDDSLQDVTNSVNWASPGSSSPIVSNVAGSKGLCVSPPNGSANISAVDPGTGLGATATMVVSRAELASITLTPQALTLLAGKQHQVSAIGTYRDATRNDVTQTLHWYSSDPKVAVVSNKTETRGMIRAVSSGDARIKATHQTENISAALRVHVTISQLSALRISPSSPTLFMGQPIDLKALGRYSDGSEKDITDRVSWQIANSNIASLGQGKQNNRVTPVTGGHTEVKAIDPVSGFHAQTRLKIAPPKLDTIAILPENLLVPVGGGASLQAIGTYTDGRQQTITEGLTWTSSKPSVAVVASGDDPTGVVTGMAVGTAAISVTDSRTNVRATGKVTIGRAQLTQIRISPRDMPLAEDGYATLRAAGLYSDGSTKDVTRVVNWQSSNEKTATVRNALNAKGLLNAKAAGTTTITAQHPQKAISDSLVLTVFRAQLVSIELVAEPPRLALGGTGQIVAKGRYSNGETRNITSDLLWSGSNDAIIVVDNTSGSKGIVTAKSIGTCTITVSDPQTGLRADTVLAARADW
jgi:uncharacterized protein YjdB